MKINSQHLTNILFYLPLVSSTPTAPSGCGMRKSVVAIR